MTKIAPANSDAPSKNGLAHLPRGVKVAEGITMLKHADLHQGA